MTAQRQIWISRDKLIDGPSERLHLWLDKPKPITEGKDFKVFFGKFRLAIITLKVFAGMGQGFAIKPGECKPVMWVMG